MPLLVPSDLEMEVKTNNNECYIKVKITNIPVRTYVKVAMRKKSVYKQQCRKNAGRIGKNYTGNKSMKHVIVVFKD